MLPSDRFLKESFIDLRECTSLLEPFSTRCNQATSTRRRNGKEAYFEELGYTLLTKKCRTDVQENDSLKRSKRIEEAYLKIHRADDRVEGNTTWWTAVAFKNI